VYADQGLVHDGDEEADAPFEGETAKGDKNAHYHYCVANSFALSQLRLRISSYVIE
jgi:hypothetical protein